MGLWSFVKETGASLFGGKEEEVAPAPAPATPGAATAPVAASKTDIAASKEKALKAEVEKLGLDTKGLEISVEGDKVHVKGKATTAEAKEKVILAVGNVNGVAEVETDEDEDVAPVFYTVKKGDTLSAIAKSTLGNANKYNEIFEANRPMLSHPDKIYPGQMLRIPQ